MTVLAQQTEPPARRRPMLDRLPWLSAALSVIVSVCLVVPESEIRAKAFKINLIAKNIRRAW